MGTYLVSLPRMALAANQGEQAGWLNSWTIFWGWFLGYAPLMGLFTAGVSRGRTLRELVLAVAILCPLVTNLWFTLHGGTGLSLELADQDQSAVLGGNGAATALLAILSQLPLAWLLIPLTLVILFMATSADSMSYAAAMVVSGERNPARWLRLFWALVVDTSPGVAANRHGVGDSIDQCSAAFIVSPLFR